MTLANPVARRASRLLRALLGPALARTVAETLDEARLLPAPVERVGGPYPISIRRTGLGVELDHHSLVSALLAQLAGDFAEDPDGVGFQLTEIAESTGGERDALLDTLLDGLGGATQRLGGSAALDFASRVLTASGHGIPNQPRKAA